MVHLSGRLATSTSLHRSRLRPHQVSIDLSMLPVVEGPPDPGKVPLALLPQVYHVSGEAVKRTVEVFSVSL